MPYCCDHVCKSIKSVVLWGLSIYEHVVLRGLHNSSWLPVDEGDFRTLAAVSVLNINNAVVVWHSLNHEKHLRRTDSCSNWIWWNKTRHKLHIEKSMAVEGCISWLRLFSMILSSEELKLIENLVDFSGSRLCVYRHCLKLCQQLLIFSVESTKSWI